MLSLSTLSLGVRSLGTRSLGMRSLSLLPWCAAGAIAGEADAGRIRETPDAFAN